MDMLDNAIENVQYANAKDEGGGAKPLAEWKIPTLAEYTKYMETLQSTSPKSLEIDGVCSNALGLYMVIIFMIFVKTKIKTCAHIYNCFYF